MVTEDWSSEYGSSRVNKIMGEVQLRRYGRFIENYAKQLNSIEESFLNGSVPFGGDPINVKLIRQEESEVLELVDTDNKVLNKVVSVFAALCMEVRERKEEATSKFYDALLLYGEECDCEDRRMTPVASAKYLPLLQEISCFVTRCHQIVIELVQQLAAIYTTSQNNQIINSTNLHFEDMMDHLGEVLVILMTLDKITDTIDNVQENWSLYKRLIRTVHLNVPKEKLLMLESVAKDLENHLLSGKIFQNCLEKLSEIRNSVINSKLGDEIQLYLKNMLTTLEGKESEVAHNIQGSNSIWIKVNCLFVLNAHLFGLHDKKMLKQMWDVSKKFLCVTLSGNVLWRPDVFLAQHLSHIFKAEDKKQQQAIATLQTEYLNQKDASLTTDVQKFTNETCFWVIQISTLLEVQERKNLTLDDLKNQCTVLLNGVKLAGEVSFHLKTVMNLHAALGKPMTKTVVLALCKLVELLKSIERTYQHHYFRIAQSVNHVLQYLNYQILNIIINAKNRLVTDKSYTKKHLDTLSAFVLAEKVLFGSVSFQRCLVARLALSIARANSAKALRDEEVEQIYSYLYQLKNLCKMQEDIQEACDTSFLYFQRVLLPVYFNQASTAKLPCLKMSYMTGAMSDSVDLLSRSDIGLREDTFSKSFKADVLDKITSHAIKPICENVETNLRLQVHSHLRQNQNANNPLVSGESITSFTNIVNVSPMKLFDSYVDIKSHVEHYLDLTFYNLTTVALHDWKSYGEMRSLGKAKYDLSLVHNQLPYQTLEHGLDVLEIMRNIHIFVSKYLYNLNNQIFVEQSSENKHLNTINIRHISNSIRMHGTGIMNTTVNFTYQFLRKKFYIFSQFLFDEQIKSRLTKDIMYFKESKSQTDQKYSYERADKFNKGIRKLGLSADGLSYLDQFRILISQIGNAMGYVRMIRSGGMHCCSNSLNFIPELEDIVKYGEMTRSENLSETTCEAAERLDHVINDLTQNFAEGTQYFKLLVDVFASDFRNPKNSHLQNFYIIVPPLTINFVEHMIAAKDKMNRRNKTGATFTDDGFAMGIAYVLKLLSQNKQFDSLHWFESVRDKYAKERASLAKAGPIEDKLKTTNLLTAKRLDTYQQEFDLLYFGLSSAKIFFQKQVNTDLGKC